MAQPRSSSNKYASLILVVLLLLALFVVKTCQSRVQGGNKANQTNRTDPDKGAKGLNRNPAAIHYSKHAKCRMECRFIDESEVKDILENGKINYAKSDLGEKPDCKRRYAVEGFTRDKQKVRIIFAPCQMEVTVVTVIDLGKEWTCRCD